MKFFLFFTNISGGKLAKKSRKEYNDTIMKKTNENIIDDEAAVAERERKQFDKMTKSPIARLIIGLGIPTTLSMMVTSLYNLADTYFVSRIGDDAITAAASNLLALMSIIQAIGFTFGMGSGALISRLLGKRDREGADKVFSSSLFVSFVCGHTEKAADIIRMLKSRGCRCVLATNPIFPAVATGARMQWAGLDCRDFDLVTTYENARYCKPNLDYYRAILTQIGETAENCVMVGNDVTEDMVAKELGMQVFLLTDCMINKENKDISQYPHGSFDALRTFLEENIYVKERL